MDEFLKKQDKNLETAETLALKRILRFLKQSRAEVIYTLLSFPGGFEEESLLIVLKNIDSLLLELHGQLGIEYRNIVTESAKIGKDDQIELLNKFYGSKMSEMTTSLASLAIELKVLTTLETNVDEFLGRFTGGLREKIKSTIQQSFIHGRSQGETITSIRDQYHTALGPTKRAVHHIYQTSYNAANHEVLEELEKSVPSAKKQWYSHMDKETTLPCKNLHEQIKSITEPFIEPESKSKFMYPPACYGNPSMSPQFHFCRSRAIPYFEGEKNA